MNVLRRFFKPANVRRLYSTANTDPVVVTHQQNGVVLVKLNRPEKLNAMTVEMGEAFQEQMKKISVDPQSRVVVLTGEGRAFSAGGDLDFLLARTKDEPHKNSVEMLRFYKRFLSVRDINVPVICAINGHAVGAGACLSLATDIRIASSQAKIGLNFTKLGLHPGLAATHFLSNAIGPQNTAYLLLTGELVSAQEALRLGMLFSVEEPNKVVEKALQIANSIAKASPVAVKGVLRSLRLRENQGLESAISREADGQSLSYASADMIEGLNAIKEKRDPVF